MKFAVFVTITILAMYLCAGCAATCRPPEARAAQFGTVLECEPSNAGPHNGHSQARCLISTPDGDVYRNFKVCE